eukprot:CAMPEP_0203751108 /NCGR_PEP_ID=MMETSP0098-20131031/5233_1 /ASSEMBLY_ACC=CAM_ASM_000208 /TAXON_ID=96639 /ORGANISM=" , Strain NY0313808BC1" /LENGTH=595 /DNA_ID=CAMNT_0050640683 /DNA_START=334 /DNA_END=2121 /DNA_ORIENTATION=-
MEQDGDTVDARAGMRPHPESGGVERRLSFQDGELYPAQTGFVKRMYTDLLATPRNVMGFYSRLSHAFNWRFVAIVSIVYGINQGVGEGYFGNATGYYFNKPPPKGLGLEADRYQSIAGFANVPWQIKSIYGITSDTFPLWGGLYRTPYVVLAGILGVLAWSGLFLIPALSASIAGLFLFFGNLSVASPDVMIDASVAERCRTHPHLASDLQTLCWASFGIGKLLAAVTWSEVYEWGGDRGPRILFGLTMVTSAAVLVPSLLGWLLETEESDSKTTAKGCAKLKIAFDHQVSGPLYRLAVYVLILSMSLGVFANWSSNSLHVFMLSTVVVSAIVAGIYVLERRINHELANASIYIFLIGCIQPSSQLMFYWMNDDENNCSGQYGNRPCFDPEFIALMQVVSYLVFIFGTSLYNKYVSVWTYKQIWTSTQILMALLSMFDFVLIMRWNLKIGIPDKIFILGDEIFIDLIKRINTMPLFVLTAAACPKGVEATMFAMNMGLSNMGGTIGGYTGMGLMWLLGGIHRPEFKNLEWFVVLRGISKLFPLVLIPFLVPDGSPGAPTPGESAKTSPGICSDDEDEVQVEMANRDELEQRRLIS